MVTGLLVTSPQRTATVRTGATARAACGRCRGQVPELLSVEAGDVLRLDPFKPNPDPGAVALDASVLEFIENARNADKVVRPRLFRPRVGRRRHAAQ